MAAPMEVSLPQTKSHVHVICHIRCQVNIDYHNQHECAALIGLFHAPSSVLPSVESYPNSETDAERSTGVPLLSAAASRKEWAMIKVTYVLQLVINEFLNLEFE